MLARETGNAPHEMQHIHLQQQQLLSRWTIQEISNPDLLRATLLIQQLLFAPVDFVMLLQKETVSVFVLLVALSLLEDGFQEQLCFFEHRQQDFLQGVIKLLSSLREQGIGTDRVSMQVNLFIIFYSSRFVFFPNLKILLLQFLRKRG